MKPYYRILQLNLLIICVFALPACSFLGGNAEPTPGPPVTLTYISFLPDADSNNVETQLIEQFEATQANITVNRRQYQQSPRSYLAQDPPPDLLVAIADYDTFTAIDDGLALDISDVWRDTNLIDSYPAGFRAFGEREGRHYFLPIANTWTAIYYNQSLFAQYNLSPPASWDELMTLSETLWQSGHTPFALPRNDAWSVSMWFDYLSIRLHGPAFHQDLLAGRIPYDDFRVQTVFEQWRALIANGYLGESQRALSVLQSFDAVSSGEAAMVLTSPVLIQDLPEQWRDNLSFFAFPVFDPTLPIGEVTPAYGYLVPAGTQHPAEVAQFLAYISSAPAQTTLVQQVGGNFGILPIHQGVDANSLDPVSQQGLAVVNQADVVLRPFIFASPEAISSTSERIFRAFLRDPETLSEAIEQLEQARQQAFPAN